MTYSNDQIEKARQAVMRFQELLEIMRKRLEKGEQAYHDLFAHLSPEQTDGLQEKAIQRLVAPSVLDSPQALSRAVLDMRFHTRDLEHAFDELSGVIARLNQTDEDDDAL